ncbi:hypothetical protein AC249_AIPGENE3172 [Exaiptasia diaphana]|nr:hypothetical protein AC249_AIPGENE3172 [Exaiptasia diaphana]
MLADDSVHDCTAPCPGHATNKPECEKKFCCGGPGAFTVYQIGGMKCHSLAVIKVLKDYNVDVEQSHFTPVLNEINRKTQIPMEELKKEIKKPAEPADYKVLLKELTQSKVSQGANADKGWRNQWKDVVGIQDDVQADKIPNANACCSPDCDWLLNFLEIDKTVVKCVD